MNPDYTKCFGTLEDLPVPVFRGSKPWALVAGPTHGPVMPNEGFYEGVLSSRYKLIPVS